jgi:hypothetical protein
MTLQSHDHPVRAGRIFWGVAFVAVGALLLLERLGVPLIEWESAWRFWPLILILAGASLLAKNRAFKVAAVILAALMVAVFVVGLFASMWGEYNAGGDEGWAVRDIATPMTDSLTRASLVFESSAGSFHLADTTADLLVAKTRSSIGEYTLDRTGNSGYLRLRLRKKPWVWGFGAGRNRVDMRLNAGPVWDLTFNVGAANLDVDASEIRVDRLSVNAGASDIRIRVGAGDVESSVKVKCGASSVRIDVPASAGCRLRVNAPLSGRRFSDFRKAGDGTYVTDNYNEAASKITVEINAGVSDLKVRRY